MPPMSMTAAPELIVSDWLNTARPLSLRDLRGKVVVIEAFQMLCPGCVAHGLPQAAQIARTFAAGAVQVIGLHCVFEHHEAQGGRAPLEAFIHEYRWPFPIAIDAPSVGQPIPRTMEAYALRGTPSLVIIDAAGVIRHSHFGQVPDMAVGAQIMALVAEGSAAHLSQVQERDAPGKPGCDEDGCRA
jgi:peroxiredoxin